MGDNRTGLFAAMAMLGTAALTMSLGASDVVGLRRERRGDRPSAPKSKKKRKFKGSRAAKKSSRR